MTFQLVGALLVLLGLGLLISRSELLLPAALFFTFFENVAIVVISRPEGDYGVPVWMYFVGLTVLARLLHEPTLAARGPGPHRKWLLAFVVVCCASLVVTYRINGAESIPPASLLRRAYPQPVALDSANFVILVPMLVGILLATMIARDVRNLDDMVRYLRTVALAVTVVAALGMVEFAAARASLPNPLAAVRAIEPDRAAARLATTSLYRLSSVSFEPSTLARVLLVGLFVLLLARAFRIRLMGPTADLVGLAIVAVALLLTSATTAFVGVVMGLASAALFSLHRDSTRAKVVVLGSAAGSILLCYWAYERFAQVRKVLDLLVFQKTQSDSYLERTTATENAMETLHRHPFLGVGIGESGAYDLVSKVGSNIGWVGLSVFAALVIGTLVRLWRESGRATMADRRARGVAAALGTVILMLLLVFQVTGFYFETAYFWAILGIAWSFSGLNAAREDTVRQIIQPRDRAAARRGRVGSLG